MFLQIATEVLGFSAICTVQPRPVYLVLSNETQTSNRNILELEIDINDVEVIDDEFQHRRLRKDGRKAATDIDEYQFHNIGGTLDMKNRGIPAWACSCAPNYYCLSASATACAISSNKNERNQCIHTTSLTQFARNIWFPMIILYSSKFTCVCYDFLMNLKFYYLHYLALKPVNKH